MQTSRDLWPILSVSLAWLPVVEPDGCTEEEEDLIDGVVQMFTDWLEISDDVETRSRTAVRDAQRGIIELLNELKAKNLAVHSGTIDDHPIGDRASPILVSMAIFKIVRVNSERPSPSAS